MSAVRQGVAGATRNCPHCKATILDSASVCPACRGHLRFGADAARQPVEVPLRVEGTIQQPRDGASEYSVVLSIRNERGEEVTRQVVGVGALKPEERRSFTLSVELFAVAGGKRPGR
jgi:hypothetical protein